VIAHDAGRSFYGNCSVTRPDAAAHGDALAGKPGRGYPVERMAVAIPLMVRWSGRRRAAKVSAFASAGVAAVLSLCDQVRQVKAHSSCC